MNDRDKDFCRDRVWSFWPGPGSRSVTSHLVSNTHWWVEEGLVDIRGEQCHTGFMRSNGQLFPVCQFHTGKAESVQPRLGLHNSESSHRHLTSRPLRATLQASFQRIQLCLYKYSLQSVTQTEYPIITMSSSIAHSFQSI